MKELIKKAKEKGFINRVINEFSILNETTEEEEIYTYLYLCELKKWLMDEHNVFLTLHLNVELEFGYSIQRFDKKLNTYEEFELCVSESEIEALIKGLTKAIELI